MAEVKGLEVIGMLVQSPVGVVEELMTGKVHGSAVVYVAS